MLSSSYVLTLSGTPATGDSVFPYTYSSANGQLTINQNSAQPLNIAQATAIVSAGGVMYVLDNEANPASSRPARRDGTEPDSSLHRGHQRRAAAADRRRRARMTSPCPIRSICRWKTRANCSMSSNQGNNNTSNTNSQSGIAGYVLDPTTHQLTRDLRQPIRHRIGSAMHPRGSFEPVRLHGELQRFDGDWPSDRPESGVLRHLRLRQQGLSVDRSATWCIVDGTHQLIASEVSDWAGGS